MISGCVNVAENRTSHVNDKTYDPASGLRRTRPEFIEMDVIENESKNSPKSSSSGNTGTEPVAGSRPTTTTELEAWVSQFIDENQYVQGKVSGWVAAYGVPDTVDALMAAVSTARSVSRSGGHQR